MTHRENLLKALRRENPEWIPYSLVLCDHLIDKLYQYTGTKDYEEYFDLPVRFIFINQSKLQNDFSCYYDNNDFDCVDEWGVRHKFGSVAHFSKMQHPMRDFETKEEVEAYPFPDMLEDYRWEGLKEKVEANHEKGVSTAFTAVQIFETAWYLRGLDNFLVDMYMSSEIVTALLDRMTDFQTKIAQKAAALGVDTIIFGDDVGSQRAMMMDPKLWKHWLKPTMAKAISAAKEVNSNVLAYYHTDGNVYDIIPDLIEIGVDILNPVQPECMDPARIKAEFGDKISFWGTIGTQTTMPFGSTADVERAVLKMVEKVGYNGGLLLAPTHLLEPEVPLENIFAFVEAVKKYGKYSINLKL